MKFPILPPYWSRSPSLGACSRFQSPVPDHILTNLEQAVYSQAAGALKLDQPWEDEPSVLDQHVTMSPLADPPTRFIHENGHVIGKSFGDISN